MVFSFLQRKYHPRTRCIKKIYKNKNASIYDNRVHHASKIIISFSTYELKSP